MPGKKYRSIKRPKVYEALKRKGYSKAKSARISNAQAKRKRAKRKVTKYGILNLNAMKSAAAYMFIALCPFWGWARDLTAYPFKTRTKGGDTSG